jgi:hypothetical protein
MKKLLLFLIIILSHLPILAQTIFSKGETISGLHERLRGVHYADIDNDGDLDIVTSTIDDHKISWFENVDGNGSFSGEHVISYDFTGGPNSIFVGDLNNDNYVDIVYLSFSQFLWYENDGHGQFNSPQPVTTANNLGQFVRLSDINGDGNLDIITAKYHDISWLENYGNGNFSSPQNITNNDVSSVLEVLSVDVDGDGDTDIISASNYDHKIAWYENDGAGNFGSQQIISTNFAELNIYSADIDGDNDNDILFTTTNNDKIGWFANDGNGNFGSPQIISTNLNSPKSPSLKDIDGDGDLDAVCWAYNEIVWFTNDGNGNFGSKQIISNNYLFTSQSLIADIDGDGDNDLIGVGTTHLAWLTNDGNGNFSSERYIPNFTSPVKSIYTSDLDGDGDMDVVSASSSDNKIVWYKNDGHSNFVMQQIISDNLAYANVVMAADIDGDGKNDVVASGGSDIVWFKNDGNGYFLQQQVIYTSPYYVVKGIYLSDINSDGNIDVVMNKGTKIVILVNDGNGNFSYHQITENIGVIDSFFLSDLDGDNYNDIILALSGNNEIAWFKNDGSGHFIDIFPVNTNVDNPKSVFACDLDGDGDKDILSASSNDNKIAWYENTGNGNFGPQQIISTNADGAMLVFASDFDGDGDLDVLSVSTNDDKIAWYENVNNGNFGIEQIITSNAIDVNDIFSSDLDGDGDKDILSASTFFNKITWYENLGPLRNKIYGNVNIDINNNGCSSNSNPLSNIMVLLDDGVDTFSTMTTHSGVYQFFPETGSFTSSVILAQPSSNYYSISPTDYNITFNNIGNSFNGDYCITPITTVNDLNVSILPLDPARPGFDVEYQIVYQNAGTTQISGDIVFSFDNTKLTFLNASETVSSQTNNSLTFIYSDLNPLETRIINVLFSLEQYPTVFIGDNLAFEATINPVSIDNTPVDNVFNFNQNVVGSFDPNDINCLEGDSILLTDIDKYLHYIIRFQNTGNYYASFIRVHNVLDPNLDWESLQILSSSHNMVTEIKNGNEIDFKFNAIYLPDSNTDEENSHGYIAYRIKPKNNLILGDIINNQAEIYFDYNLPVYTNTASTTITESSSLSENNSDKFTVNPIPVKDKLFITSETEIDKIEIYNKLGQKVIETSELQINTSGLSQGIYLIKITDVIGNQNVKKFIKIN